MPHDDFAFEPVKGLPEEPPKGEEILWQGRPDWWALALESLSLKWVMGYFVLLAAWRLVAALDLMPFSQAVAISTPFIVMGLIVCALLALIAWVQARATVYTITNRRVVMRCLAGAERIARLLAEAAEARLAQPQVARATVPAARPAARPEPAGAAAPVPAE